MHTTNAAITPETRDPFIMITVAMTIAWKFTGDDDTPSDSMK